MASPDPCPIPDSSNSKTAQYSHAHYTFCPGQQWASRSVELEPNIKHLHNLQWGGRHFSPGLEIYPEAAAANWPQSAPIWICCLVVPGFSSHQGCRVSLLSQWGHPHRGSDLCHLHIKTATVCLLHAFSLPNWLVREDPRVQAEGRQRRLKGAWIFECLCESLNDSYSADCVMNKK